MNTQTDNSTLQAPDVARTLEPSGELQRNSGGDAIVTVLSLAILAGTVALAYLLYADQIKQELEKIAAVSRAATQSLDREVLELERSISRIGNAFKSTPGMTRQTFWRLMREPSRDLKAAEYIGYAPRVAEQDIVPWVAEQQNIKRELLTYQAIRALRKLEPLYYQGPDDWRPDTDSANDWVYIQNLVSPILVIENEMGKVLNSQRDYARAISRAVRQGELAASKTLPDADGDHRSLMFSPVYSQQISPGRRKDLEREREKHISGVLNIDIDVGAMLQSLYEREARTDYGICVHELGDNDNQTLLYASPEFGFEQPATQARTVDFFGKQWQVSVHQGPMSLRVLLPSTVAVLAGLIMMVALHSWHVRNRSFKRMLHRRLAEQRQALNKSTELLQAVFDAAPVGIEVVDESGELQLQNRSSELRSDEHCHAFAAIANGSAQPLQSDNTGLHSFRLSIGEGAACQHFELITRAMEAADGTEIGRVIVSNEITERVVSRQVLEQHVTELEAVNRELEALTYSATHDMQEPLRRLASLTEIQQQYLAADKREEAAELATMLQATAGELRQRFADIVDAVDRRDTPQSPTDTHSRTGKPHG